MKVGEIKVSPLEAIDSLKFYAEKQIPMSQEEMEELQQVFRKAGYSYKSNYRNPLSDRNEKVRIVYASVSRCRF
jgi:signal recognition particle subunit SEC65